MIYKDQRNTILSLLTKSMLVVVWTIISITSGSAQDKWKQFGDYWYAGVAELSSYELKQHRYGEIHEGHAVLIFVTEPFSRSRHVKLDNSEDAGSDEVTVLKLNLTKKFLTGIYPYSMMMSSFVPVSYDKYPDVLKVTAGSQEWCGQTFTQLNLDDDEYEIRGFSYFESEGDFQNEIDNEWLEDELWQRIRIDPDNLPTGSIKILPGTLYQRLSHKPFKLVTAMASLKLTSESSFSDTVHKTYQIIHDGRILSIHFKRSFPYEILGWEEIYDGKTTVARKIKSIREPYWVQNKNEYRHLRQELGLKAN